MERSRHTLNAIWKFDGWPCKVLFDTFPSPFGMFMRIVFLLLTAVLLTRNVYAQGNGVAQTQCSIAGTVTDSSSGQVIKGAEVIARTAGPRMGLPLRPVSGTSDVKGEFSIDRLDCGRYVVRAFHDGYITNGPPTVLTLSPGQRVENVVVLLTPGGVVSGHVTDEAGKGFSGASVELLKYSYGAGKRDLIVASNATTNKAGEFRFEGLAPGRYFLRGNIPSSGVKPPRDTNSYVPVYFPNATDLARASVLDVKPAQELAGMDLAFVPVRGLKISGQVVDQATSAPRSGVQVTLLSDEGYTNFPNGQATTDKAGHFEFSGLPAGSYVVVAQPASEPLQGKTFWGQAAVMMDDTSVSDLKIMVSNGHTVTGHIRADSGLKVELGKLSATIASQQPSAVANLLPELESAPVSGDGTFRFRNVPEGSYSLNFFPLPSGTYLRSSGSTDVLEGGLVVGSGGVAPLDVTISAATASIEGSVLKGGSPAAGVSVVLIPEGKRRNQEANYRFAMTDRLGQFSLRSIPPGDYKLFAWDGLERREFMNPDFVRQFENQGRPIHLDDGSRESVQLEAIAAGDSGP